MTARTLSERIQRRGEARSWAGYRQSHIARSTGTLVVIVRDPDGSNGGDPECPWVTICDDHGRICSHPTLALARDHAAARRVYEGGAW